MSASATETPPAAAPATKQPPAAKPTKEGAPFTALSVPLRDIVSNIGQSRGMGVLYNLKSLGYGMFQKLSEEHADKEPIWEMLNSDDGDLRSVAIALIEENEPHIVGLATDIEKNGQLQPIGVTESKGKPGKYNAIFGMRRCLALAYNRAKDSKVTGKVEAKLFKAGNEVEMKFLALSENNERENESPIDRAMTYKWLTTATPNGGGLKVEDVTDREDISKVTYYQYVNLLDKRLEKYRIKIHAGEMSVDRATTLLKKLKEDAKAEDNGKAKPVGGQGARFPSAKRIKEYYDGALPSEMSDELKELYKDDTVRKFLALNLGFTLTPFKEKPTEAAAAKTTPAGKKAYSITRDGANAILLACGHTDCAAWSDADVIAKLENAPGLGEEGADLGEKYAQDWFDLLLKQYAEGYTIKIEKAKKPKKPTAAS